MHVRHVVRQSQAKPSNDVRRVGARLRRRHELRQNGVCRVGLCPVRSRYVTYALDVQPYCSAGRAMYDRGYRPGWWRLGSTDGERQARPSPALPVSSGPPAVLVIIA